MTREDIIKMAKEAGLLRTGDGWTEPHRWGAAEIERFADLVAAAARAEENEACAKVCEEIKGVKLQGYEFAAAIRARGNT